MDIEKFEHSVLTVNEHFFVYFYSTARFMGFIFVAKAKGDGTGWTWRAREGEGEFRAKGFLSSDINAEAVFKSERTSVALASATIRKRCFAATFARSPPKKKMIL